MKTEKKLYKIQLKCFHCENKIKKKNIDTKVKNLQHFFLPTNLKITESARYNNKTGHRKNLSIDKEKLFCLFLYNSMRKRKKAPPPPQKELLIRKKIP